MIKDADGISFKDASNFIGYSLKADFSEIDIQPDKTKDLQSDKYLMPDAPYLEPSNRYTLVMDLDETLLHYEEVEDTGFLYVRPDAETFLQKMSQFYDVVVFTAGT